ncbi:hypothetical protein ACLB2K_004663 [Fragaria x ananassa]
MDASPYRAQTSAQVRPISRKRHVICPKTIITVTARKQIHAACHNRSPPPLKHTASTQIDPSTKTTRWFRIATTMLCKGDESLKTQAKSLIPERDFSMENPSTTLEYLKYPSGSTLNNKDKARYHWHRRT